MATNIMNKPILEFYQFLNDHKIKKSDKKNGNIKIPMTHYSFGEPYGSFSIPDEDLETFFHLYDKVLTNNTIQLHMIEKHKKYGPIVIDIDEKYDSTIKRQHTKSHIIKIVNLYKQEIINCFDINENDKRLTSFVFEKPNISYPDGDKRAKYVKDGIHIIFPYIISDKYPQFYIRKKVIEKIPSIYADIPIINTFNDLVDIAVIDRNGWFMYGSTKPKSENYELMYIFDEKSNVVKNTEYEDFENYDSISKFFSIRRFNESDAIKIRETHIDSINMLITKTKSNYTKNQYKLLMLMN